MSLGRVASEAVQSLEPAGRPRSKNWKTVTAAIITVVLGAAPCLLAAVVTRADSSDGSEKRNAADTAQGPAALAVWLGTGGSPGSADALYLSAAWTRAGGVNVAVLTGTAVRAEAAIGALLRLRARILPGDLAVVGYSGPVAVRSSNSSTGDLVWIGIEGDPEIAELPISAAKFFDSSGGTLVVIQIASSKPRAESPWKSIVPSESTTIPVRWTAAAPEGPVEVWFGRTRAADALGRELQRVRDRNWAGTVEDWLRAAKRRCELESGGRTWCELVSSAPAESLLWPFSRIVRSRWDPVGALGHALEQLADHIEASGWRGESDGTSGWTSAWTAARGEQAEHLAEWINEVMLRKNFDRLLAGQLEAKFEQAITAWRLGRLDEAEQKLHFQLQRPDASAAVRALLAEIRWARGDGTGAVTLARSVLPPSSGLGRAVTGISARVKFHAARVLGFAAEHNGDVVEAERWLRVAVEAAAENHLGDTRALAETRRRLAHALRVQGNINAAVAEAEIALTEARADSIAQSEVPLILLELGEAHAAAGQTDSAIDVWRGACDEWARFRDEALPMRVVLRLAGTLLQVGMVDEAIRRLEASRGGAEAVMASEKERVVALRLLSWAWNQRGDRIRALQYAYEAWRLALSEPSSSPEERAILYADLAALHLQGGDAARAAEFAERAVAEWGRARTSDAESLFASWVLLAEARMRLHQHADAAAAWSNATTIVTTFGGSHRLQVVRGRTQETRAWIEARNLRAALETSESLVELIESSAEELPSRLVAEAWLQRARALEGGGHAEEADAAYGRAWAACEADSATAADSLVRAEIAVRRASLQATRGHLFRAEQSLRDLGELPQGLSRELRATVQRVRSLLQEAMKPHGTIMVLADLPAIQVMEMEYRGRRARQLETQRAVAPLSDSAP